MMLSAPMLGSAHVAVLSNTFELPVRDVVPEREVKGLFRADEPNCASGCGALQRGGNDKW